MNINNKNLKTGERLSIPKLLVEKICEDICDNFCKYRDTCDENCDCDITRNGKFCPLDFLHISIEEEE